MPVGPLQPSVALSCAGVAALGFVLFVSTGQDDSYITYWPAYTLAEHGEMVNYNGERVEQSSSLLHVVLLAATSRLSGGAVPVGGYWLGVIAGVLTLLRAVVLAERLGHQVTPWLPLLLGTTSIYVYWWFGGLETPLVGWLGVELAIAGCALVDGRHRAFSPSVLLVTFAFLTVRPESFMVLGPSLAVWWGGERFATRIGVRSRATEAARREILRWLGVCVLVALVIAGFRWLYFGAWVPQPVTAKLGGGVLERVASGLHYTLLTALLRPYAVALFVGLFFVPWIASRALREGRAGERFVVLLLLANVAFIVSSGGDWMRGGRFFAHLAPLAVVLCVGPLVSTAASGARASRLRRAALGLALAANVGGFALLVCVEASGRPLWRALATAPLVRAHSAGVEAHWSEGANRVRTRDLLFVPEARRVVGELLEHQPSVTIVSTQAGMVMYYLAERFYPRIAFIDVYGLTTRDVTALRDELGLASRSEGVVFSIDRYLDAAAHRDALPVPDLVFDLGAPRRPPRGYDIVYQQLGVSPGIPLELAGRRLRFDLSAEQYLAVRRSLVPHIGAKRRDFDWSHERLRPAGIADDERPGP